MKVEKQGHKLFDKLAVMLLIFIGINVTILSSCKKEELTQISKLQALTGRKWQLQNLYYQSEGDPSKIEARAFTYKMCELDDIYEFGFANLFKRSDSLGNATRYILTPFHINVFGPYGISSWSVDSNFSQIVIQSPGFYKYTWKILLLNDQTLEVEENYKDYLSYKVLYTYRFNAVR